MTDYRGDGGPDFRDRDNGCYFEGDPPILRVAHSVADVGYLCRGDQRLLRPERSGLLKRLHVPGLLARGGAIERIRLSPEGFGLRALRRCAAAVVEAGHRVLLFSFHSPSVVPGFTPYVSDASELAEFLARIDGFLRYFRDELGGRFATPDEVLALAVQAEPAAAA
jgi:hypothetical protein